MDQSSDTNRTRMEHILLLEITIGYKYLGILITRLGDKLIVHSNQYISKIDKWLHGDSDFPFGIWKSGGNDCLFWVERGWKNLNELIKNHWKCTPTDYKYQAVDMRYLWLVYKDLRCLL